MCKFHENTKKLISDVHSSRDAEFTFGIKSYMCAVADDDNTALRRAEYQKNPDDKGVLLKLGDALAYQMRYNEALTYYKKASELYPNEYIFHRKLAVRYLSILDLDKAKQQLLWCLSRTDNLLDVKYLLAVTAFCMGKYCEAIEILKECYELCQNDGEMYVAVMYWHIQCLVKSSRNVSEATDYFFDGLVGGHHEGYMRTIELFLDRSDINENGLDELNKCIFRYGQCAYHQFKGDYVKARDYCKQALALDTYFSSFAYLGAYSEESAYQNAIQKLEEFFKNHDGLALAFSGGVDSALLLCMAKEADTDVKAYLVCSQFQPHFEIDDAKRIAEQVGKDCDIINLDVLANGDVVNNKRDRCYHCKHMILGKIKELALRDGYRILIDGTNADDDLNERPGARALNEFNILSPLRECGMTKLMIRRASQEHALFTFDKPSYSCLATRVATCERLTEEKLCRIERAETYLFSKGYKNFRVRLSDNVASIEIDRRQNKKFAKEKQEIFNALSQYFDRVCQSDILR